MGCVGVLQQYFSLGRSCSSSAVQTSFKNSVRSDVASSTNSGLFLAFRTRRLTKIVVHPLILSNQGPEPQECRSGPVRRTIDFFLKMRPNAVSELEKSVGSFWPRRATLSISREYRQQFSGRISGRPTLYWQKGRDKPLCNECERSPLTHY